MTAIVPKKIFDTDRFVSDVESLMKNKSLPAIAKDFERGVRTWDHKPSFKKAIRFGTTKIEGDVFPSGTHKQQYLWVHNGVHSRLIVPRNRTGLLHFREGYISATTPGSINSRGASRTGKWVHAKEVKKWPGIEPRNFSFYIAKIHRPRFIRDVRDLVRRAAN